MNIKKKFTLLLSASALSMALMLPGSDTSYAISDYDFDVNSDWDMSGDITTKFSVQDGVSAYSTGKATVGKIGVTAKFVKQADRNDGASYLSGNGKNQGDYAATSNMFYANPDPSTIPALAINAQPSNGVGGALNTYKKANFSGNAEVGTVTLTFDKTVTDPVLDLSGLGGYVNAIAGFQLSNGGSDVVGRGSFNATDIELITEGVSFKKGASNSNLEVSDKMIKVKDRNTFTHATLTKGDHIITGQYKSPKLAPAGTGSVILKGTFKEVSLRLYHNATPWSKFPTETYGTSRAFFTNYDKSQYGDGVNGLNVINPEKIWIGNEEFTGLQNWDKFRISLRLPKPSSIGDKVWIDENKDGIQDASEKPAAGVTVKLLDKDGNPAKDFNGNPVAEQKTDPNGNYKFDNLAAGEYIVEIVPKDGQKLTTKGGGTDATVDSNFDNKTNKTDSITLEPNKHLTDIDAGLVEDDYKVDYEFKPSEAEGTPKTLPQGVEDQLPEAKGKLKDGAEVQSPKEFTPVKDEVNKGTWTFEAWDKETATIDGADEHVIGTWVFTKDPVKEYKLDYEFKPSDAEGTPKVLPKEVTDQLPKAKEKLADGTEVPSPKDFTEVKDEINKGTWTFEAWDKETATIDGADEHVVGTWVFTKDEEPQPKEYKVTHEFKSGTEGKELPEEVTNLLPANQEGKKDGEEVTPTQPEKTEVPVEGGKWVFKNYDKTDATIDKADEHFVGTWVFEENKPDPAKEYKLDYEFQPSKAEGTPETLPEEVLKQLPKAQEKLADGTEVPSPKDFTEVRDDENKGTWTFEAWDKETATIDGADEHVIGTWKFTKDEEPQPKEYKVTHEFKSGTEGKELPEEVTNLLPANQEGKKDGEEVTPTQPEKTEVPVEGGKWVFKNYDKTDATIDKADEHFVGTWVFEEDKTPEPEKEYKLDYEFQPSKAEGTPETLPEEVLKQLPKAQEKLADGTEVPSPKDFTEVRDDENKGTWTFEAWDKETATIDGADEHVIGTWKFTKDEEPQPTEYKVTHEFKSGTKGKELPKEVLELVPENQTGKKDGDKVTPTQPAKTEVPVEGGKWVFKNYDETDATIDKADEHFVGTWVFEENKPDPAKEYKLDYEFKPSKAEGTPDKLPEEVLKQLPKAQEKLADGTKVDSPKDFTPVKDEANKGTWTFEAWDKETATIKGADEHVIGTWVFTKDEEPQPTEYKVTHEFKSGTEGKELPEEVIKLRPADKEGNKDGSTVGPSNPEQTTVEVSDGTWEFKGYDRNQATITGKDENFVGTWEFTPKKDKGNVYVKYVDDEGNVLEEQSVVKKDAPVGEDYTTEQKTFDGYTFKEMDETSAPKEGKVTKEDQTVIYVYTKEKTPEPGTDKGNVYVKYVDDEGNVLEEQSVVKKDAPVGEAYTTELKTFNGYEFARMADGSAPANGEVQKGDQQVTYVYKKTEVTPPVEEIGSVYVRYITEDGSVLEDYTAVKEGAPVGENYTTEQKIFDGYVFKGMSADSAGANGNVINGDLYVTYVYKLPETPEVDPEGEKGNVYVNYITVDGEPLANDVVKENAPVGEVYTTEQRIFDGYEFVRMGDGSADANGNVQEGDQYVTYVYKPIEIPQVKTGNVYVKYVTEDGNVLEAEKAVQTDAEVGTKYTTEQKTFDGYEFTRMGDGSADANGNVVEGDLHVVYVYREKSTPKPPTPGADKITKFVDENGNEISKSTKGDNPKKDIDGYEFVKTEKDKDGNTVHIYKKVKPTPEVVTEYVDEDGNTISDKENGTKDKKDIKGYEFVKTEKDEKGNTKHIYKKKETPTVDKITKYVDENGNKISESTKGENPKKDIDGYEFVKTEKDKDGNTVHIYRKKETPTVGKITKYVDENGNEISKSTKGDNPKKDIDGYEFVKTEKDKDGNTVHIYKKKETPTVGKITKYVDENGNEISKSTKGDNPKKDIDGYEFVKTEKDKDGNTVHIYKKKDSQVTNPSGNSTVVSRPATVKKGNKAVKGNVRTGVGSSLGALVTLAGSALALFKSKKRK